MGEKWEFYWKAWHEMDLRNRDVNLTGLWDGFTPNKTVPYTGPIRFGENRFWLDNGTILDNSTYLGYDELNFTQLDIMTKGELDFGLDPKNVDTNNNSIQDGEELLGYFLLYDISPRNDRVSSSNISVWNPWNEHQDIELGGWALYPVAIEEPDGHYLIDIQAMPNPMVSSKINTNVTLNTTTVAQYSRSLGNHSYRCTIYLGNISEGYYQLNISASDGPSKVRLCSRIGVLVQGMNADATDGDCRRPPKNVPKKAVEFSST